MRGSMVAAGYQTAKYPFMCMVRAISCSLRALALRAVFFRMAVVRTYTWHRVIAELQDTSDNDSRHAGSICDLPSGRNDRG